MGIRERLSSLRIFAWHAAATVGMMSGAVHGQCDDLSPMIALGPVDNPTLVAQVLASTTVSRPGANSIRLYFASGESLPSGSFLRITSVTDGLSQDIDSTEINEWRWSSAWFNGGAVLVELVCGPNTTGNEVRIIRTCELGAYTPEEGCPPCVAEPAASSIGWGARLIKVVSNDFCSGAMWSSSACLITAQHCLHVPGDIAEFNVPPSLPNGTIVHPAPQHQYVIKERRESPGGSFGDWAVLKLAKSAGSTAYQRQRSLTAAPLRRIAAPTLTPASGDDVATPGYGLGAGVGNLAQKLTTGDVTSTFSTGFFYTGYSQPGNSGGGVTFKGPSQGVEVLGGVFSSFCWSITTESCETLAYSVHAPGFAEKRLELCRDCVRDCDGNGHVDLDDRLIFLGWLASGDPMGDLDGNGFVEPADLVLFDSISSNRECAYIP